MNTVVWFSMQSRPGGSSLIVHRHPALRRRSKWQPRPSIRLSSPRTPMTRRKNLQRGLLRVAPPGLAHAFYPNSGSTAVEVALKMALGFFHHVGDPRSRIVVMEHCYHGDTIGTLIGTAPTSGRKLQTALRH